MPASRLVQAAALVAAAATLPALAAPAAGSRAAVALRPSAAVASSGPAHERAAAPQPGASGIGDSYFPLDGNGGYDVRHYDVHVGYDLGTRRLAGWTRITLRARQDLSRFNLDFLLPVSEVRVEGARATYTRPVRHELQITPATPLARGATVEVVVRYAGHPGRFGYAGESNWLASRREVVTMNEPHMAPWWFPANDHPRDKARMDFHITAPNGREVVANGLPIGRDRGPSRTTWHWRVAEPMVPYLAFFAAGDFAVARGRADGRPWQVAVSQHLPAGWRRDSMTMLRRTPQVVRWLESELGDYPFGTTGGLVTSLNPGFALENQTRPTYPPLTPGDTYLLVHELAHQWFGDDVAVRSWRDIWLNEGFATYLEKRYDETHGGQSAATWLRNRYDALGAGSSFWSLPVADPGPGHLFDAAVYLRGAMTLQALRQRIGGAEFRTLLRTWVRDHARGNGSTAQFRALAEQVSGADLTEFFDAWLVGTTKPADIVGNGLG